MLRSLPRNIVSSGAYRSNLELINYLRSSFSAAQQDCAAAAITSANGHGHGHGHGNSNGSGRVLYLPRIDWSAAGLQEDPGQYDVTVKLFFLPNSPVACRAQFAREALRLVRKKLRVSRVNLLIVSFPDNMKAAQAQQGDDEKEAATWSALEALHREGLVEKLGTADFGSEKLARFLQLVTVKPAVNQINVSNCCNVPPPLAKLAEDQGIRLLVHSDRTNANMLPKGTLRELLGQDAQGQGGLHGHVITQWVVKYTAVVRDRGVIENMGYFAGAELVEGLW